MNHYFIINPNAGPSGQVDSIRAAVPPHCQVFSSPRTEEAVAFVRQTCEANPNTPLRFYACGGDGTLNRLASALIDYPNAALGIYPSGSGNDYVKCFRSTDGLEREDFLNIERQLKGATRPVDVMRITVEGGNNDGVYHSVNVCNFGFDATVARQMNRVRRWPLLGGHNAYTTGIVAAIFAARYNRMDIDVDGKPFLRKRMLLCTLSNGQYIGGAYYCAPHSINDDGLIEVTLFRTMSLLRLCTFLGPYRKGTHLKQRAAKRLIRCQQARTVTLSHRKPFYVCIDGELLYGTRYTIEQLPRALNVIIP